MDPIIDQPKPRRTWLTCLSVTALALLTIFGTAYAWWQNKFPYGYSHCCDKLLVITLFEYADNHKENFPNGESSPEASLSLLYSTAPPSDHEWLANLLRGKSVPYSVTSKILADGKRLGPESCGWHYVEGLRSNDDPRIALFWDKAGLGHHGGRLPGGGHIVTFVDSNHRHVTEAEWPEFIKVQKELLAKRK